MIRERLSHIREKLTERRQVAVALSRPDGSMHRMVSRNDSGIDPVHGTHALRTVPAVPPQ